MPDLHEVEVRLAVFTSDGHFLMDKRTNLLPSLPLPSAGQPLESARSLLCAATAMVDGHWIALRHVGVEVVADDVLVVLYAAEMPEPVALSGDYHWVTFADLVGNPVFDLFRKALVSRC